MTPLLLLAFPLLLAGAGADAGEASCPPGWLSGPPDIGCLLLASDPTTWQGGLELCSAEDSRLLQLQTVEQWQHVVEVVEELAVTEGGRRWWTAASDLEQEGRWVYSGTGDEVPAFLWDEGRPLVDNTRENCLVLNYGSGYLGVDIVCTNYYYPLCQRMV